nr:integrase, catalytic region, zinc finger, CCHC-type, peptidase aspartic, catalytic [Tanacetum cinerariifolium]
MIRTKLAKEKKRKAREVIEIWMNTPIAFPLVSLEDVFDEPIIIKTKVEWYLVRRAYVDEGALVEVMFEHCFENLSPRIKVMLKETQTNLVRIAGEMPTRDTIRFKCQERTKRDKILYRPRDIMLHQGAFGLKNAGVTYQRLVDTTFQSQIGRNLEAYVDDMVIKSNEEKLLLADVAGKFDNLRKINMKLNSKKCTFGVEDVKRSLPFFNTLKNITKDNKHEYKWTIKAEEAFQQMKRCILNLSSLNLSFLKETLYAYLAMSKETMSAVLMTDRKESNVPFIINAVKGQVLAEFISKTPNGEPSKSCFRTPEGSGVGLVLIGPSGIEYTYDLHLMFTSTKNEAEYKALLAGLRITRRIKIQSLEAKVDAKLVASQIDESYMASNDNMIKYLAKAKENITYFKSFSIKNIMRNLNQNIDPIRNERRSALQAVILGSHVEMCGPTAGKLRYLGDSYGSLWDAFRPPSGGSEGNEARILLDNHARRCQGGNPKMLFMPDTCFRPLSWKGKFVIVAIDYFTKWIKSKPLERITGKEGKENMVNILKSIDEGPYQMGTVQETLAESTEGAPQFGPERPRVYSDLTPEGKDRYNADIRAINILLQGLPKNIYTLINHYTDAKDIWDNVKMLLEGSELTKENRESQLYDDFEHFRQHKGESIHDYYVQFAKLINDMINIKMTMSRLQLNSMFMNNMLPEWGRFVTAVKLNRGLKDSNYDQLYAYLKQHETHAKENKMMLEHFSQPTVDPLALMSNVSNPQHYSPSSSASSSTQGMNPRDGNAAGYGGAQMRVGNVNPGQARLVKCYNCNEQLLFLAGRQDNAFDDDVDEKPVQDLELNVDNVFQDNDYDTFDFDVDEAPTAQTMFMANLSSADPVTDEVGPSYDSDILSEVPDQDHYQDAACAHHEEHVMHDSVQLDHVVDSHADYTSDSNMILYDQYVKDNEVPVIHSDVSSIPNDAFIMIYNNMCKPHAQSVSNPSRNTVVKNSLTAELTTYKEY